MMPSASVPTFSRGSGSIPDILAPGTLSSPQKFVLIPVEEYEALQELKEKTKVCARSSDNLPHLFPSHSPQVPQEFRFREFWVSQKELRHDFEYFCANIVRRRYRTAKNDKRRLIFKCIVKECDFCLHATWSEKNQRWCKSPSFNPNHSCSFDEHRTLALQDRKNSTIAPLDFYARQCIGLFDDFKHPRRQEIERIVFENDQFKVDGTTARKIRLKAVEALYGSDEDSFRFIPSLFEDLKSLDPMAYTDVRIHSENVVIS